MPFLKTPVPLCMYMTFTLSFPMEIHVTRDAPFETISFCLMEYFSTFYYFRVMPRTSCVGHSLLSKYFPFSSLSLTFQPSILFRNQRHSNFVASVYRLDQRVHRNYLNYDLSYRVCVKHSKAFEPLTFQKVTSKFQKSAIRSSLCLALQIKSTTFRSFYFCLSITLRVISLVNSLKQVTFCKFLISNFL